MQNAIRELREVQEILQQATNSVESLILKFDEEKGNLGMPLSALLTFNVPDEGMLRMPAEKLATFDRPVTVKSMRENLRVVRDTLSVIGPESLVQRELGARLEILTRKNQVVLANLKSCMSTVDSYSSILSRRED